MKRLFLLLLMMGVFFTTQAQTDPDDCEVFIEYLEENFPCVSEMGMPIDCALLNIMFIDIDELSNEEVTMLLFGGVDPCSGDPVDGGDDPIGGGDDDPFASDSLDLEIFFAELSAEFPDCLADYTAADFADVDELFLFVFESGNCFGEEPEDSLWIGEPTLEEEFTFLQACFPDCLADYTAADFADIDELYELVFGEDGCEENVWGEDSTWVEFGVEEELAFLQSFTDGCLDDVTADDFADVDELYTYFEENCNDNDPWNEDSVWLAEELAFLQSITDGCLDDVTADDFADVDELYTYFDDNCGDENPVEEPTLEEVFDGFALEFPDCFDGLTAADFASVDELFIYVITSECDGGIWTDSTTTNSGGDDNDDWVMPDDLDDWMDDSYPNGPTVDFIFGEGDAVTGFDMGNGVSITFDENAVIISIDGLTSDNLPADIETYLIDNDYMDGVTDVTVTEDEDGNIIIVVTVEVDGGKSSDVVTLRFDINGDLLSSDVVLSGINTITDVSIAAYPNPTTDQLLVTAGSTIENIVLINQLGQVVYTYNPTATQMRVSLATIPTGIYTLKVTTVEGIKGMNILKK